MRCHCVSAIGANTQRKGVVRPNGMRSIFAQYDGVIDLLATARPCEYTRQSDMEGWNWNIFPTPDETYSLYTKREQQPARSPAKSTPLSPPTTHATDDVLGAFTATPAPREARPSTTVLICRQNHAKREYAKRPAQLVKPN